MSMKCRRTIRKSKNLNVSTFFFVSCIGLVSMTVIIRQTKGKGGVVSHS